MSYNKNKGFVEISNKKNLCFVSQRTERMAALGI